MDKKGFMTTHQATEWKQTFDEEKKTKNYVVTEVIR